MRRHGKTSRPDVFAKSEKRVMPSQIINCRFDALVDLDLLDARVALDVENAIALKQIVVELLRAANVQDRIRFAIKLTDLFQRQSGSWIAL